MVKRHLYPICEFDTSRKPIIHPINFLERTLPEKCVITFFRKELNKFVQEEKLSVIGYLHSEVLDIPIYEYTLSDRICPLQECIAEYPEGYILPGEKICITMPFPTAPGAATTIEELHAMGCEKFIICGAAGSIKSGSAVGKIIVPTAAVRDEGTSYHYLEPAREVEGNKETLKVVTDGLERLGIPYTLGKTWTTDAMYSETPEMIAQRRKEGCITVEMETAAFFAVSKYYGISLAQLLYTGDDVSGEQWDERSWRAQKSVRENMILTSIKLIQGL